jgi:hypothetical protein
MLSTHSFLKVNFQRFWKRKKPVKFDWLFLVERSIELSNLDDFSDMSRQRLIWEGLEQIESIY